MKKRVLGGFLSAIILTMSALTCFADSASSVTLNADSELVYSESEINESIAPGETFVETITIKNEYKLTSDFYMSTSVVSDLEKSVADGKAKGAGYDVKLEVTTNGNVTTLYDSTVGGEGTTSGLENVDLQDTMLIATLEKGKTAEVKLTIFFDGEGLDSTEAAHYNNAAANLNFDFKAGYEEPTGNTVEYKVVEEKEETKYVNVEVEVPGEAAKTGDSNTVIAIIALMLGVGVLFIAIGMKKKNSKVNALVIGICAAMILLGSSVTSMAAEKTYTVTFRPGAVGTFSTTAEDLMNAYNAAHEDGCVNATTTENGAIKLEIVANSAMPTFPNVKASEGYVENTAWKANAAGVVTKDIDFVADYAKLVNGVEYTILFVDEETGDSVYNPYTTLGNVGDKITATVPSSIIISDAAYYYPVSGQKATLVLDEDKTKNVLTIKYTMQPRTITEEVSVQYVEGEIITNIIPVAGPAAAVTPAGTPATPAVTPVVAPGTEEETVEIENEETPLAPSVEEETLEIGEEETPLAPSIGGEEVEIGEEETPLAPAIEESSNWLFIAGALAVLAIVAAFLFVAMKKRSTLTAENTSDDANNQ